MNIAANKITILVLLDIKSAYPSVSHELLFHVLHNCGFGNNAIEWIKCFLKNKSQYVNINGNCSNEIEISCGLIQGDNLSQTLFSLIINGVVDVIKNCKIHLYADDLAIYIEVDLNNVLGGIEKINEDIRSIDSWITSNGMQLNPKKTQSIIIGSKHNLSQVIPSTNDLPKIRVCSVDIEYTESVKYLGFRFNNYFNSETQVNSITKNVNFTLSKLRHCRNSVSMDIKLQLIKGIVIPMFDYASMIYHGFGIFGSNNDEARLNILMNSCIRFVCNLSGRDHVSRKYIELGLLNAFNRRSMLICCFMYNFLKTRTPSYLLDFEIHRSITRAGTDTVTLMVKRIHLSRDEYLFSHCASKLWNSIPSDIRNCKTKEEFAREIKVFFLNTQINN